MNSEIFSQYALPATLAIIMGGMGLSLEKTDFTQILVKPKAIITGLFSQMIVLPIIAFALVSFTNLDPFIKVGFVLIAACPGGTASNLVTHLLKGNLALCVSMSAINSLLILITLPIIVNLGLDWFVGDTSTIRLPVMQTVTKVFFVIAIPVFVGMLIRSWKKELADKLEKPLRYIMTTMLLAVFVVVIFFDESEQGATFKDYLELLPYAIALNFASMFAGFFISRLMKLGNKNSYTISIEVGLQNSALAIFVASTLLNNHKMAVVAVIYSSFTFFTTALFGYLAKKITKS